MAQCSLHSRRRFLSPAQWLKRIEMATSSKDKAEMRYFLLASTATGPGPNQEEQLLRLMIWVSTFLKSSTKHSRIRQPLCILAEGTAWCDQQVKVFLFLAWHLLGLEGRELAIYHTDGQNGHTVCEVYYNKAWHLFDVHSDHQMVYRSPSDGHILSYHEILATPEVVKHEDHWWHGANGVNKAGFYTAGSQREASIEPAFHTNTDWCNLSW
jgi:hypothetical protein